MIAMDTGDQSSFQPPPPNPHDERPLPNKKKAGAKKKAGGAVVNLDSAFGGGGASSGGIVGESSANADLEHPEEIPKDKLADVQPWINVFDQYTVQCLLSKNWKLREHGVKQIQKAIHSSSSSMALVSEVTGKILSTLIAKDKNAFVFIACATLLQDIVDVAGTQLSAKELQTDMAESIPHMVNKLGDNNTKVRNASSQALLHLCAHNRFGSTIIAAEVLKPMKNMKSPKPVQGRLDLLLTLIPQYGLDNQNGIETQQVMTLILKCFDHANGNIRKTAQAVTIEIYKIIGPEVMAYLKNVKPALLESLQKDMEGAQVSGGVGGGASSSSTTASTSTRKKKSPRSPRKGGKDSKAASAKTKKATGKTSPRKSTVTFTVCSCDKRQ
eukprot:TRINITY_DN2132_c0_g1_i2.p1 TRINITY_DN2132_c0_g1~~TRINITY_DN2132_c0_g1_i2.p1  ORF type:complete len:384 (-),score=130.87 TRINITY_DN2132_c0_g1_i2:90-1241(-)